MKLSKSLISKLSIFLIFCLVFEIPASFAAPMQAKLSFEKEGLSVKELIKNTVTSYNKLPLEDFVKTISFRLSKQEIELLNKLVKSIKTKPHLSARGNTLILKGESGKLYFSEVVDPIEGQFKVNQKLVKMAQQNEIETTLNDIFVILEAQEKVSLFDSLLPKAYGNGFTDYISKHAVALGGIGIGAVIFMILWKKLRGDGLDDKVTKANEDCGTFSTRVTEAKTKREIDKLQEDFARLESFANGKLNDKFGDCNGKLAYDSDQDKIDACNTYGDLKSCLDNIRDEVYALTPELNTQGEKKEVKTKKATQ